MVGSSEDGGWTCVQRDQKDSTFTPRHRSQDDKNGTKHSADTHRTERGNLIDALLIVCDFIPRCALLAEPEHPAKPTCEEDHIRDRQRAETLAYEHTYFGGDARRRCRWRPRCPRLYPFLATSPLPRGWRQRSRSAWKRGRADGAARQVGQPGPGPEQSRSRSLFEKLRWSWRGSGTASGSKSSRP